MSEQVHRLPNNLDEIWEELIVSILAVNNRSLEKTYALLPLLRKAGIVDPANLTRWDVEEVVARLDDAELVTFGVGEHDMTLFRSLTDVDVPGAESERPCHRPLLVIQGRACQIEVHLVRAGLLLLGRKKSDPEPGVIARQERNAVWGVVGHPPAQDAGPVVCETERIVRIEAEREEVTSHSAPYLRSGLRHPERTTARVAVPCPKRAACG